MKAVAIARVREINRLWGEIGETLRTTLPKAIRVGELLTEQKAELAHGEWLPWLKANTSISERTARDYMRFWENRERLKPALSADIQSARKMLAVSKPHQEQRITARIAKVRDMRAALAVRRNPEHPIRHRLAMFLRKLAERIEA